jgi:hypothetical protein
MISSEIRQDIRNGGVDSGIISGTAPARQRTVGIFSGKIYLEQAPVGTA